MMGTDLGDGGFLRDVDVVRGQSLLSLLFCSRDLAFW